MNLLASIQIWIYMLDTAQNYALKSARKSSDSSENSFMEHRTIEISIHKKEPWMGSI